MRADHQRRVFLYKLGYDKDEIIEMMKYDKTEIDNLMDEADAEEKAAKGETDGS